MEKKKIKSKIKSLLFTSAVLGAFTFNTAAGASSIPFANTDIGNQATLTYQTLGGQAKMLQSNIVITTINQAYAVQLEPNREVQAVAGKDVYFNHTLTNYGNGVDSFTIKHDYGSDRGVVMYLDANNNAVLDPGENPLEINAQGEVNIPEIDPWKGVGIIVKVKTKSDDTGIISGKLTATSRGDSSKTDEASEKITIITTANLNVYKALSSSQGASDIAREVTIYLKVYNESSTEAKVAEVTDSLNTKFNYIDNSAKWQDFGSNTSVAIADNNGAVKGVEYNVVKRASESGSDKITLKLPNVSGNTSIASTGGVLSFKVMVKEGEAVATLPNEATYKFKTFDATGEYIEGTSNKVNYSILKYVRAQFSGDTILSGQAGEELRFVNVFKNIANAAEVYNLSISDKFFPVGTTFRLALQTPGGQERPVLDNNGDLIYDTGVVGINETVNVVLYAQLPTNITNIQSNYTVKKIATSVHTPTYNVNALDTLNTLRAATVDLTNNQSLSENKNAPGQGVGPEQSPVTQIALRPGESGNFILHVNNTSSYITDTYRLDVSTRADFSDQTIPAGVSVKFISGGGAEVTSTSPILPNNSERINVKVDIALNTTAKTVPLYFRVTSVITGSKDIKYDSITVSAVRDISITPNNTGSTYAGGQVIYTHTVRNNGNVLEGDGRASEVNIVAREAYSQWSTEIFMDTNGNGIFDIGIDTPFRDFATIGGLVPGQEVKIFARVSSEVGTPAGQVNTTTISAEVTIGTYPLEASVTVATDKTTILAEDLTITKKQKLELTGKYTSEPQKTDPGKNIFYRIDVKNDGQVDAKNVVIRDTVPYYTTQISGDTLGEGIVNKASYVITSAQGTQGAFKAAEVQPGNGNRGDIVAQVGVLRPGETATLYFQVKVDSIPTVPAQ